MDEEPGVDLGATRNMYDDARAALLHLRLEQAARKAVEPAPSIHYDDFPREVPKRDIRVDEAAQRLANALHLHLD
jgi:hypothetical protein